MTDSQYDRTACSWKDTEFARTLGESTDQAGTRLAKNSLNVKCKRQLNAFNLLDCGKSSWI